LIVPSPVVCHHSEAMPNAVPPLADVFAIPSSAFGSQTFRERVALAHNRLYSTIDVYSEAGLFLQGRVAIGDFKC
jgi:hypothetical protein